MKPVSVDLDLLADYAGGALDGTPDHARVAHLVATDPAWTAALEELRTAEALVRTDLAGLDAEPMPDDVAARLDAALAAEGGRAAPAAPVVALATRRRRYRIAAAAAVAAGVIGLAGYGGYAVLGGGLTGGAETASDRGESNTSADTAEAPGAAEDNGEAAPDGDRQRGYPVPVAASGTDYTRETLSAVRDQPQQSAADAAVRPPEELARLADPRELTGCLEAVRRAHPGGVTMVDYARFESDPALIIALGTGRVVVAGPDCGRPGPDTRYATDA